LNQREYCEAQGIPLKALGNWRAKFKAEPQPPARRASWCAERLGRSARCDRGLSDISPSSAAKIAVGADRVRGPAEQVCEKWTLTTLPLNSLVAPKNSLLGLQTFPVPLRREFRWESLNSLANCTPKSLQRALNLQDSLLISLLTGNLVRRLVRSRLHRQPCSQSLWAMFA
jgi:hypothetical protein